MANLELIEDLSDGEAKIIGGREKGMTRRYEMKNREEILESIF